MGDTDSGLADLDGNFRFETSVQKPLDLDRRLLGHRFYFKFSDVPSARCPNCICWCPVIYPGNQGVRWPMGDLQIKVQQAVQS